MPYIWFEFFYTISQRRHIIFSAYWMRKDYSCVIILRYFALFKIKIVPHLFSPGASCTKVWQGLFTWFEICVLIWLCVLVTNNSLKIVWSPFLFPSLETQVKGTISLSKRCDFVSVKHEKTQELFQVCRICAKVVVFYNVAQYGLIYDKRLCNWY